MENEEQARRLESEAEGLEGASQRVGEQIEDVRADWEAKEGDASVPGAQPDPGEAEPGTATGNPGAAGAVEPDEG